MIYVFLADGFEEIEALAPVDILRRGGIEVKTVGVTGKTVIGAHDIVVTADITIDEVDTKDLSGMVLPGGLPGTTNLESSSRVIEILEFCNQNNLLIGAICAAPSILCHNGLLNGKNATCFPGFEKELKGANVLNTAAVRDGNIITGQGAGAALEFGFALLSYLKNEEVAVNMQKAMCCPNA